MLLDIPPHLEALIVEMAKAQGISASEWALSVLQQNIKPDDDLDFDIERMAKAIGEYDDNGRAIHISPVPDWATADLASFDKWLASV